MVFVDWKVNCGWRTIDKLHAYKYTNIPTIYLGHVIDNAIFFIEMQKGEFRARVGS